MNLFLIGYRGTGKSTVAALVAETLGWQFHDTDLEVERRSGQSIAEIFAQSGEPVFRQLESAALDACSQPGNCVVSLGGGIVLAESNRRLLAARGRCAWLTAEPETLWKRIVRDATTAARRPNLTPDGGMHEVAEILKLREPLYRECADWVVDTEGKTPAEVAGQLVSLVQQTPLDSA